MAKIQDQQVCRKKTVSQNLYPNIVLLRGRGCFILVTAIATSGGRRTDLRVSPPLCIVSNERIASSGAQGAPSGYLLPLINGSRGMAGVADGVSDGRTCRGETRRLATAGTGNGKVELC